MALKKQWTAMQKARINDHCKWRLGKKEIHHRLVSLRAELTSSQQFPVLQAAFPICHHWLLYWKQYSNLYFSEGFFFMVYANCHHYTNLHKPCVFHRNPEGQEAHYFYPLIFNGGLYYEVQINLKKRNHCSNALGTVQIFVNIWRGSIKLFQGIPRGH